MRMKRPRVITNCVANAYAGPKERIIEFSFPSGNGGLIAFDSLCGDRVQIYRFDKGVKVLVGKAACA